MKKITRYLLLFTLMLMLSLAMLACSFGDGSGGKDDKTSLELSVPTNLSINEGVLSWDAVTHANSYAVRINQNVVEDIKTTSYSLTSLLDGEYQIAVKAVGDGVKFGDSSFSASIPYTVDSSNNKLSSLEVSIGALDWSFDPNQFYYTVTLPYGTEIQLDESVVSFEAFDPEADVEVEIRGNTITISVTSLNATSKATYTIIYQNENDPDEGQTFVYFHRGEDIFKYLVENGELVHKNIGTYLTDHYFVGWYTQENGEGEPFDINSTNITKTMHVYAKYIYAGPEVTTILKVHDENLVLDGTNLYINFDNATTSYFIHEKVQLSAYAFANIFSDFTCTDEVGSTLSLLEGENIFFVKISSSASLNATVYTLYIYRSELLTVEFRQSVLGGDSFETVEVEDGTLLAEPETDPTMDGYTFDGWYKDTALTIPWDFGTDVVTNNIKIYPKYSVNSYTLTFETNGGSAIEPQTKAYDTLIEAVPVRDGYKFGGWYDTAEFNNNKVTSFPCENVTVYAKWLVDLTFSVDGKATTKEVQSGALITRPDDPKKDGAIFDDWYTSESGGEVFDFSNTKIDKNTTLYARWIDTSVAQDGFIFTLIEGGTEYKVSGDVSSELANARFINIPNEYNGLPVTTIAVDAFKGFALESLVMGDNIVTIGQGAFESCTKLEYVKLSEGLSIIGQSAFSNTAIKNIIIPSSVTSIEGDAFGLTLMDYAVFMGNTSPSMGNHVFFMIGYIIVPTEKIDDYQAGWSNKYQNVHSSKNFVDGMILSSYGTTLLGYVGQSDTLVIPDTITAIADEAIPSHVLHLTIPSSVGDIDDDAFRYASSSLGITWYYNGAVNVNNSGFTYCVKHVIFQSELGSIPNYALNISFSSVDTVTIEDGITSIGNGALSYLYSLTSLEIPDSVTSIGATAFNGCYNLTSITIPSGVTVLSEEIFAYCKSLTSIILPDTLTAIEDRAFYGSSSLASITIPQSVTKIGDNAFSGCHSLKTLTLPKSLILVGEHPFVDCISLESVIVAEDNTEYKAVDGVLLTKNGETLVLYLYSKYGSYTVPEGVKTIADYAFYNCTQLTSIILPSTLVTIGDYAFYNCTGLVSVVIPNSTLVIGEGAFSNCTNLRRVIIGSGVTKIESHAFSNCRKLSSIAIPDSTLSIGSYAFFNCVGLKSVALGKSLETIGDSAFYACKSLATIGIPNSVETIGYSAFAYCIKLKMVLIKSSSMLKEIESSAFMYCEQLNSIFIPIGITHIKERTFYESGLTSIELPSNLQHIFKEAFYNCDLQAITLPNSLVTIGAYSFFSTELASLTIPSSVDSIGTCAFAENWISTLTIENGVRSIEDYAFKDCLINILTIPNSVESLGVGAFYHCYVLEEATIGSGVTMIQAETFYNCYYMKSITFLGDVEYIGDSAFENCSNLTTVSEFTALISIGDYAFYNCRLESLTLNEGLLSIGKGAFIYCDLKSVVIPNSVESIGIGAFELNYEMASITLPFTGEYLGTSGNAHLDHIFSGIVNTDNSVPYTLKTVVVTQPNGIGEGAFANCSNIESIIIPAGTTAIPLNAFYFCSSLTSIIIPDTVTSIGDSSFYYCISITSVVIPNTVNYIGELAFGQCERLENVTLPNSLTVISNRLFVDCIALTSITIPESVTDIEFSAFSRSGLTSLTIPSNLVSIGEWAFTDCEIAGEIVIPKSLTSIGHSALNRATADVTWHYNPLLSSFEFGHLITKVIIDDDVTAISDDAFKGAYKLTSIDIPTSVLSIGKYAFAHSSLTSVTIPSGVTVIEERTFFECTFLESVTILGNITAIYYGAFYNCESLTSITIPESVRYIDSFAFYNCASFTSITIPSGVEFIGGGALRGCNNLTSLSIPFTGESLTSTSSKQLIWIFGGNANSHPQEAHLLPQSLTSVTITNANGLSAYAFNDCEYITSITLPLGITTIPLRAFTNCSRLTSFVIPSTVTTIEAFAFADCSSLASVDFSSNLLEIGEGAFGYCSVLENITIPSTVTTIGTNAFVNCFAFTSFTIPQSVTTLGERLFGVKQLMVNLTDIYIIGRSSAPEGWHERAFYDMFNEQAFDFTFHWNYIPS